MDKETRTAIVEDFKAKGETLVENAWRGFVPTVEKSPMDILKFRNEVRRRVLALTSGLGLVINKHDRDLVNAKIYLCNVNDNRYADAAKRYLEVIAEWSSDVDLIYATEEEGEQNG